MAPTIPRITKMAFSHADATAGYSVHVWTDRDDEMDVTMTVAQYHSVRGQLAEHGSATIPTGVAA